MLMRFQGFDENLCQDLYLSKGYKKDILRE